MMTKVIPIILLLNRLWGSIALWDLGMLVASGMMTDKESGITTTNALKGDLFCLIGAT